MRRGCINSKHRKIKVAIIIISLILLMLLFNSVRTDAANENIEITAEESMGDTSDKLEVKSKYNDINFLVYNDEISLISSTGKKIDSVTFEKLIKEAKENELKLIASEVNSIKKELSVALNVLNDSIKDSGFTIEADKEKNEVDRLYKNMISKNEEVQKRIKELSQNITKDTMQVFDSNKDGLVFVVEDMLIVVKAESDKIATMSIKNPVVKAFKNVLYDNDLVVGQVDDQHFIAIDTGKGTVKELKSTEKIDKYIILNNKIVYSTLSTINILDISDDSNKVFDFSATTIDFIKDDDFIYAINEYGKSYGNNLIVKIDVESKKIVGLEEYNNPNIKVVMINNGLIIDEGKSLRIIDTKDLKSKSVISKQSEDISAYIGRDGIFELDNMLKYRDLKTKKEFDFDINIKENYKVLVK